MDRLWQNFWTVLKSTPLTILSISAQSAQPVRLSIFNVTIKIRSPKMAISRSRKCLNYFFVFLCSEFKTTWHMFAIKKSAPSLQVLPFPLPNLFTCSKSCDYYAKLLPIFFTCYQTNQHYDQSVTEPFYLYSIQPVLYLEVLIITEYSSMSAFHLHSIYINSNVSTNLECIPFVGRIISAICP